jgi:hypothetical protein
MFMKTSRVQVANGRYAIADLPTDEAGLKSWCETLWAEKDMLLADWTNDLDGLAGNEGQ